MKRLILGAVLFAAVGLTAHAAELKDLAGSYKVTAMTKSGMDAPKEALSEVKGITIEGDKFTVDLGGEKKTAVIKIDSKAKVPTLDLSPEDGPNKGKAMPGIYSFEKGVLKIAITEKSDRPIDFKGAKEGEMVLTLEKDKK